MVDITKDIVKNTVDPFEEEDSNMLILSRKDWAAHPPLEGIPKMFLPLKHVRFTHTGTDTCKTHLECKKLLKKLQYEQMETLGHNDITYNFMIGSEGYVYEGRGWENEPDRPPSYSELSTKSIEIAYIGDFDSEAPTAPMLRAAFELVIHGIKTEKLYHFFEGIHLT